MQMTIRQENPPPASFLPFRRYYYAPSSSTTRKHAPGSFLLAVVFVLWLSNQFFFSGQYAAWHHDCTEYRVDGGGGDEPLAFFSSSTSSTSRSNNNTTGGTIPVSTIVNNNNQLPSYKPAHFFCLCPTTRKGKECNPELCDTILTYNDTSNNQFNLPGSTWTTARNTMYYLANRRRKIAKLRGEAPESHYCFMDGDTKVSQPKQVVLDQLANETELAKIIAFNYRRVYTGAKYLYGADANLNCFAEKSMDQYLPYSTMKDDQAWSLSQRDLVDRANLEEPFVFKMYDNINVWNPSHNNAYPRDHIRGMGELMQQQLSEGFSEGCHPTLESSRVKSHHECSFEGNLLFVLTFNRTHRIGFY